MYIHIYIYIYRRARAPGGSRPFLGVAVCCIVAIATIVTATATITTITFTIITSSTILTIITMITIITIIIITTTTTTTTIIIISYAIICMVFPCFCLLLFVAYYILQEARNLDARAQQIPSCDLLYAAVVLVVGHVS